MNVKCEGIFPQKPRGVQTVGRRLLYLTMSDVSKTPYFELALPALVRNGWHVTMVAPNADQSLLRRILPYECVFRNLNVAGGRASSEFSVAWELLKSRTGPYDLIYLQSAALGARGVIGVLGRSGMGRKVIYQTLDYFDPQAFPVHSKLEGALVRRADGFLNAEYHRALVCKAIYGYKCPTVVAPPLLPAAWPIPAKSSEKRRLMTGGDETAFVLMLHGGYNPLRKVRELFEALARLPQRFRLVMTSSGNSEALVDDILTRLGIQSRVVRLGMLDFPDILQHSVNADAGLLLYDDNDAGNYFQAPGRLSEYVACGLPVIASNFVGLENAILKHDIGVVTDSKCSEKIAQAIIRLAESKRDGRFDGTKLWATFKESLSFDLHESKVCKMFDTVISTR